MKQATMPDIADSISTTFSTSCPTYVVAEGATDDAFDHVVLSDKVIKERSAIGKMDIPISNQFKDQFNAKYMSQVFPFTLNYSCGGANYPDFWATDDSLTADFVRDVWRRCNGEAMLLPSMYAHMLATRPEAQLASDWTLVPGARNLQWRYAVLRASYITCKQPVLLGENLEENLKELIDAGRKIFERLQGGSVRIKGEQRVLAGNIALILQARARNIISNTFNMLNIIKPNDRRADFRIVFTPDLSRWPIHYQSNQ